MSKDNSNGNNTQDEILVYEAKNLIHALKKYHETHHLSEHERSEITSTLTNLEKSNLIAVRGARIGDYLLRHPIHGSAPLTLLTPSGFCIVFLTLPFARLCRDAFFASESFCEKLQLLQVIE